MWIILWLKFLLDSVKIFIIISQFNILKLIMIELIRPALFNTAWTCTLDSYINCETYRLEYRIESPIDRNIIQTHRDDLREKLDMPERRSISMTRDKLQTMWLIKSRKKLENVDGKIDNMVVVYKEEDRTNKHAACIVWELDFHRVIAWGNGRVLLPKWTDYEFYSYEK
jgi:hypothetical protein